MATQPRIAMRAVRTIYGTPLPRMFVPEKATSTFKKGAVVFVNAGYLDECGADPALFLGLADQNGQSGAADGSKSQLVDLAAPGVLFVGNIDDGSAGQVTAATDRFKAYGIAKHSASGKWYVDKTDSTDDVVVVWDFWDGDGEVIGDTLGRVIFAFQGTTGTWQFQGEAGT